MGELAEDYEDMAFRAIDIFDEINNGLRCSRCECQYENELKICDCNEE